MPQDTAGMLSLTRAKPTDDKAMASDRVLGEAFPHVGIELDDGVRVEFLFRVLSRVSGKKFKAVYGCLWLSPIYYAPTGNFKVAICGNHHDKEVIVFI